MASALLLGAALAACDQPTPVAVPTPGAPLRVVVADSVITTDWSEYPTGLQPADFSQMWDPTPHFLVADDSTGGKVLRWAASGQSRNRWGLAYDGAGSVADQEVYTELRIRSLGGGTSVWYMGSAAVRMSGTASDEGGYAVWFVATSTERALALSTWTGGGYTQLATVPLAWAEDTWYAVRLRAIGTTIQARIWPRGTAEPAAWTMSVTDARWPAGRPGVSNHDNGAVEWDVWQATLLSGVTLPPLPPPPPATSTAAFTFAADSLGQPPAGWTETAYPANSGWTVAADSTATDGRVLRNLTTATSRHILRLDAVPDSTTDQEVVAKLRLADGDGRGPGVALRHTMNGSAENAYVAYLRPNTDQVEINRFQNGAWQFVAVATFPNDPGRWYWLRFRAEAGTLRLRVWNDAAAEPAGWLITAANPGLIAGSVGLYTYEPNTVDYDAFGYAGGGATAPIPSDTSPPPPPPPPPTLTGIVLTPAGASLPAGGTVQFQAYGRLSNGDSAAASVSYVATGGTISGGGLYTAGSTAGSYEVIATSIENPAFADTSAVSITVVPPPPPPPPPPSGTQWYTDFSTGAVGAPMPDLRKMRSSWEWNFMLVVRPDAQAPAGKVLRLEGSGATNGGSRPHAWLLVPPADEQEVVVRLRTSSVSYAAGGAYLSGSIDANNDPQEYGARLSKGRFQLWNYRGGGFNQVDAAAPEWVPNQWMWVRLRMTATQVMARYWVDGQPEPATWRLTQNRNFGGNGGSATIPLGHAGLYANTRDSGIEFSVLGAAIGGASAPTSGTPVIGTLPAPTMPGALVATDFSADPLGQPPGGWTPTFVTTGVTWNVADLGGGDRGIRSVGTGNAYRLLDYAAMSDATGDQEVLLRIRPSTTNRSYTAGIALRIEPAGTGGDSFYAVALGPQWIDYLRVVNGSRTVIDGGSMKFDYAAGSWYWMRARVQGGALMGRVWRTDEPEPASWFRVRTDATLTAGSAGIYHVQGDVVDFDEVSIRAF